MHLWGRIVAVTWPDPSGLTTEAVEIAGGSNRAFALAKHLSERPAGPHGDGWKGPCEYELRAMQARIASAAGLSPSAPAGPSAPATPSQQPESQKTVKAPAAVAAPQVVFLLDGSGSVGDEEFSASTSFIARTTTALKAQSEHKCRVSSGYWYEQAKPRPTSQLNFAPDPTFQVKP